MGWLIAALVIIGLAILPLGIQLSYGKGGALVRIRVGPVIFRVYPGKDKKKKEKAKDAGSVSEEKQETPSQPQSSFVQKFKTLVPFLKIAVDFLNQLRKKVVVKRLECHILLAGGDPANLAVNYGRTWMAVSNMVPQLHRMFDIRRQDIDVNCDFHGFNTQLDGYAEVAITFGRLLGLILRYSCIVIRQYVKQMKLRKGGAEA